MKKLFLLYSGIGLIVISGLVFVTLQQANQPGFLQRMFDKTTTSISETIRKTNPTEEEKQLESFIEKSIQKYGEAR